MDDLLAGSIVGEGSAGFGEFLTQRLPHPLQEGGVRIIALISSTEQVINYLSGVRGDNGVGLSIRQRPGLAEHLSNPKVWTPNYRVQLLDGVVRLFEFHLEVELG